MGLQLEVVCRSTPAPLVGEHILGVRAASNNLIGRTEQIVAWVAVLKTVCMQMPVQTARERERPSFASVSVIAATTTAKQRKRSCLVLVVVIVTFLSLPPLPLPLPLLLYDHCDGKAHSGSCRWR